LFFLDGIAEVVRRRATLGGVCWKVRFAIESVIREFWMKLLPFLMASESVCYNSYSLFV